MKRGIGLVVAMAGAMAGAVLLAGCRGGEEGRRSSTRPARQAIPGPADGAFNALPERPDPPELMKAELVRFVEQDPFMYPADRPSEAHPMAARKELEAYARQAYAADPEVRRLLARYFLRYDAFLLDHHDMMAMPALFDGALMVLLWQMEGVHWQESPTMGEMRDHVLARAAWLALRPEDLALANRNRKLHDDYQVWATSKPAASRPATAAAIGPQFWKYDLSEYVRTEEDELRGLGGRWISRRYERKDGADVTRAGMVERIRAALAADGWKPAPLPGREYVLSKIWQRSDNDLGFTRAARGNEESHWFFNQYIHISDDAKVLCVYAEVGW